MTTIRDAKINDLNACEQLSKVPELMTPEEDYPTARYLKNFINEGLFIVAEQNNKIAGYIAGEILNGNVAYLNCLVIDKKSRGKGIGTALMKEFNSRTKKLSSQMVFFFVPKSNQMAVKFYQKHGFVKGKEYFFFCKNIK